MRIKLYISIIFLSILYISCEARDANIYMRNLKVGDVWNPPYPTHFQLQNATEEMQNYEFPRGLDRSIFVCVKNGKVVSIWTSPNSSN